MNALKSLFAGLGLLSVQDQILFDMAGMSAPGACLAFDGENYDPTGSGSKGAVKCATYSTSDTIATIETDGYFDDLLVSTTLNTGDFLMVYSSAVTATGGWTIYGVTVTGTDVALTDKTHLA